MPPFCREEFLSNMQHGPPNTDLWDMLADVTFWVKDHCGRFVWINDTFAKQAQMNREQVIGKRDIDCFPGELANIYMHDDAEIIAGGPPIKNKPELVISLDGGIEWRQTSKFPVRNKKGEVFGTTGISRQMAKNIPLPPEYATIAKIITFAQKNLANKVMVKDLAERMHISISTLERYIHAHFGITPNALLRKIKFNRAVYLLSTSTLNIGEIAAECGYESESSFSRAFRHRTNKTPGEYRQEQR